MELSRREVPLYGRVKVCPFLQAPGLNPDEAEFYVVLEGSTLDHITVAQRAGDGHALHFVAPGHNLFEMVSVTAYIYTEGRLISCLDKAPLEYILDDAQELAEFLVTHSHCLSTRSYLDVLSRFRLTDDAALKTMDVNVTRAMANLDYPYTWNVLGSQPGEELQPRESLLHLTVRLGLFHVTQLLLCQPGGLMAVALPNDEGDTPLKLAKESEQQAILELLTNPPSPLVTPLAGMTQVWVNSSQLLRFCHESETLTLTVQQASERNQQDSILLFRNRLRNENFLREIKVLTKSGLEEKCEREDTKDTRNNKDWFKDLCTGDHTLEDSVFEEQLVLSLDEEDEPAPFYSEKGQSESFRRSPAQSTFNAAARLSAMLNGKDQIYANSMLVDQVDDLDIKYRIAGVTGDSTRTDSRGPDFTGGSLHEPAAHFQGTGPSCSGTGPLCVKEKGVREQSFPAIPAPSLSPAQLALARLNNPPLADTFSLRGSSPRDTCALSPSLVALELDSEEDDQLNQCPFSCASTSPQSGGPLLASSGDEPDSFHASPDFSCSRTHSSSFNHPPTKDLGEPGIRLRSYSYSSPKISLVQPRVHRDTAISDLSEDGVFYSSGRSLLQALSLSKSLSLLNPVKQRALGSPEQPQDKRHQSQRDIPASVRRELSFRKRAQSAEDEGSVALADSLQHLTLSEFLKEIEEEEWDKYIIPSKSESEKYKVSRTFSFLKSRMSSTRNKNKGKGKEKECKEKAMNGHQFAAASCSGLTLCLVCDKPAAGKDLLQCSNCTINIHKGCRDSATPCMKKLQDKYALTAKNKTPSHTATSAARESSTACPIPTSTSLPVMVSRDKREQAGLPNTLSKSVPVVTERRLSEGLEMDTETGTWRNRSQSEELLAVMESSPSTDSSIIEDTVDAPLRNDFRADLLDYEAESWSLAVDQEFCKKHDKRVIKRQDVIYELMQTEMHHIQTLTIMAEVFRKGMKEELQLDVDTVDKIFPCLDELSDFHRSFFCAMKERRQNCTQEDNDKNFLIDRIGDILVQQFSNENAEKMKQVYGEFCSHHTEAVNFFKELQQQNKKFQVFIKQQSNNSLVRRREIPECILLVTQRITKYPVLLERILQHTQEGTEDNADLSRALPLIRDIIAAVDLRVSEFEKEQKLLDVLNRMENKSFAKLKNGHAFRKQDLLCQARTLKHEGLVYWKTATGRLKDVLALLLTDTLIFLQEKDQKFIFAVVDQKPPVISLQKLIVREVANEERGMFLISASAAGPEMYEVHTASKEDRNSWMRLIREAVESCPVEEEENTSESEEDRRAAEARANKIHKLQETLSTQDQQICSNLEDKLKIYAELMRMNINEENIPEPRLLVQPSPDDTPQAALLLTAALREAEKLTATLTTWPFSSTDASQESPTEPSSPVKLADFAAFQESSAGSDCMNTQSSSSVSQASDWEARGVGWTGADNLILQSLTAFRSGEANSINLKVAQSVQSLTQLLYSLQAAVTMQDSCFEVQKVLLQESERLPRGNALQEQEKQRNLEKQREELAGVLRLQGRLRQEQQRWQRECEQRRRQQEALEGRLAQREQECQRQAQRLQQEREELECQLREYQQSLERLREGQRLVGRERERLETQQRLLQSWRHNRQRSLPVMMIPVDGAQDSSHGQCVSFDGQGSVFVNEAALRTPLNNRHLHQHHRSGSLVYPDTPSAHNSLNALIGHAQDRPPQQHTDLSQHLLTHSYSRRTGNAARMGLGEHGRDPANNDVKTGEKWSTGASVSGAGLFQGLLQPTAASPLLQLQTCAPVESGNGEDGVEENIVYL